MTTWTYNQLPMPDGMTAVEGAMESDPVSEVATVVREALVLDVYAAQVAQVAREVLLWDAPLNLTMTALSVVQVPPPSDNALSLRWSDTGGASWGDPIQRTIGGVGQYQTNISFRRLGYARSRVIELSWSGGFPTALLGVYVEIETAQT